MLSYSGVGVADKERPDVSAAWNRIEMNNR
jgi:hypothetical protein